MQTPDTRFSLIEKLKCPGDMDAWSEFASIYQPLIVEVCRRRGLQHADASDVAQEVLYRVARKINDFDYNGSKSTFRGWLYCMTRNLTIDFIRRRSRDPLNKAMVPNDFHAVPEPTANESQEFQLGYQKHVFLVVAQTVEKQVQPNTWAAFWRVEIERRDPSDVATELGVSRGAVYVAKSRVIARLRKEVSKRIQETSPYFIKPDTDKERS